MQTTLRRRRAPELEAEPKQIPVADAYDPGKDTQATFYESARVDYQGIIDDYKSKATSYKTAIRSHCVDCMGGLVQQIKACTSTDCSLYPFRMGENPFDARTIKARSKGEE